MFIKTTSSKGNSYVTIAEGYRDEEGRVKHRNIVNLGRFDKLLSSGSMEVLGRKLLQLSGVGSSELSLENTDEGDILNYGYIAYSVLWKRFKLNILFEDIKRKHRRLSYDLNNAVFLSVIHRLIEPGSKLNTFLNQGKYYGLSKVKLEHIYRSLDILADHKLEIEAALFHRSFRGKREITVAFYDVTTFSFQSVVQDGIRDFGYSKDCKFNEVQVVFGLFMDLEGFPMGYELFPGRMSDPCTLVPAIDKLKERFEIKKVIVVGDRGINSKSNLSALKERGYGYIAATKLKSLPQKLLKQVFEAEGYSEVNTTSGDGIRYKKLDYLNPVVGKDGVPYELSEALILTYSPKRAAKDRKDRERLIAKAMKLVEAPSKITQELKRGGRKYIKGEGHDKTVSYRFDQEKAAKDSMFDGYYGIQTSEREMGAGEVLEAYHMLCRIEDCFRIMKSTLEVRPVFHWSPKRIEGHFLSCYIAFLLERSMEIELKKNAAPASPDNIQRSLRASVVVKINTNGTVCFLKCKTTETADNIFDITGIGRLKTIMKEEELNKKLKLKP